MQIRFTATDEVRAAIARLGRTEDVQFSPDGRRLALVGHICNRLLIVDVDIDVTNRNVTLTDFLEVESGALVLPHGIAWIDRATLVVANREGDIAIFALPAERPVSRSVRLEPLRSIGSDRIDVVVTPGSVSVARVGMGLVELIVCNNYVHHVSRHLLDRNNDYAVIASEVIIHDGLEVPDGVALGGAGRWLAISNHECGRVWLYSNEGEFDSTTRPAGELRGVKYPHGLRFSADGTVLLVADAGAPFVYLYCSDDGDWAGEREPVAALKVLSEGAFRRGQFNPQEGGPKGIDVTSDGSLMVTTCREAPLAFFDMSSLIPSRAARPDWQDNVSEAERARETLLRYLVQDRSRLHDTTDAIRRASEREIQKVVGSRSWKLTAPLRWAAAKRRRVRELWQEAY